MKKNQKYEISIQYDCVLNAGSFAEALKLLGHRLAHQESGLQVSMTRDDKIFTKIRMPARLVNVKLDPSKMRRPPSLIEFPQEGRI